MLDILRISFEISSFRHPIVRKMKDCLIIRESIRNVQFSQYHLLMQVSSKNIKQLITPEIQTPSVLASENRHLDIHFVRKDCIIIRESMRNLYTFVRSFRYPPHQLRNIVIHSKVASSSQNLCTTLSFDLQKNGETMFKNATSEVPVLRSATLVPTNTTTTNTITTTKSPFLSWAILNAFHKLYQTGPICSRKRKPSVPVS